MARLSRVRHQPSSLLWYMCLGSFEDGELFLPWNVDKWSDKSCSRRKCREAKRHVPWIRTKGTTRLYLKHSKRFSSFFLSFSLSQLGWSVLLQTINVWHGSIYRCLHNVYGYITHTHVYLSTIPLRIMCLLCIWRAYRLYIWLQFHTVWNIHFRRRLLNIIILN